MSTAGSGSCCPRRARPGSALLALETHVPNSRGAQRRRGMGWEMPAHGKPGSRSPAGTGHGTGATLGAGAAVGAVPAVIPLAQSGSSSFPGWLPLSHCSLTPNTWAA